MLFTSLLYTAICKASPDSHFAFLHFFSMGMVLSPVSCTMSRTSVHSSAGTGLSLSRVRLFGTPWTVAYQAPPSMGPSRQEYWSGFPLPPSGHLPNPGIKPASSADAAALQVDSLPLVVSYFCFLYFFVLIAEEGFLISPCYSLELCIQMLISFVFFFAFRFSSFHRYL